LKHRHSSHDKPDTHTNTKPTHERVLADIRSLYECHPTPEIFQRSWHKDAVFEVWRLLRLPFTVDLTASQDPLSHCKGFREYAAQAGASFRPGPSLLTLRRSGTPW
jgi:hypothetical protein